MTAGAVAVFFAEPSQGAPEEAPGIAADQPILTASLDPMFPPVRKVVTKSFPALKQDAIARLPAPRTDAVEPAPTEETAVASAAEFDALEEQDPRWATANAGQARDTLAAVLPGTEVPLDEAADEPGDDQPAAEDDTRTGAIAPGEAKSRDESRAEVDADPPDAGVSTRAAQVSKGVNMRSRPKSGSSVLTVIPRAATVQVVNCKVWCEVIYKGRRGFIYKDYLGGSKRFSAKASSRKKVVEAEPAPSTKTVYTVDTLEKTEPTAEPQRVKSVSSRLQ